MKINKEVDLVQTGILVVSGIAMLGGFWAYCSTVFASKESVQDLTEEVHAIYMKLIPDAERNK